MSHQASENIDSSTSSSEAQEVTSRDSPLNVSNENAFETVPTTMRPCSTDCASSNDTENEDSSKIDVQEVSNVELADVSEDKTLLTSTPTTSVEHSDCLISGATESETSKSNIEVKGDSTTVSSSISNVQVPIISSSNSEECAFRAHQENLAILHQELQQFHTALLEIKSSKSTSKDSSPEGTSPEPYQLEECSKIEKPEFFSNVELPSTSSTLRDSSVSAELNESESVSASSATFRPISDLTMETHTEIISPLPSTSTALPRSLEVPRIAEVTPSASLESRNLSSPPLEIPPVDPLLGEDVEDDNEELNGVISHKFAGAQYVMSIIPLFEHLQNDLLELKAFLDGSGRSSCDPAEDPDYGPTLDERSLASINEEFGTGVESSAAQNTRSLLSEWIRAVQSDQAVAVGGSEEPRARAAEGGEAPNVPSKVSEISQESGVDSTQSEHSSTPAISSQDQPSEIQPTLDSRLEVITNPSDVSRQLLRLNRVARRQLHRCIRTTREVLSYCVTGSPHLFLTRLETLVAEILNVLQGLVHLRQECSALLRRCSNREDAEGVTYILKVKTQIAAAYNSLLHKILTLNSRFNTPSIKNRDQV